MRALHFVILLIPFLSTISAFAKTEASVPTLPGPLPVLSGEYKFAASVDADVLPTAATELWARVFYPQDMSKPRPIVFLLHGNHSTCRQGGRDYGCGYTSEGACGASETVVMNNEGYNYLASQLASVGFIAVTINANRGITCGAGDDVDWGLNLARGRLVLRHLQLWNTWNTQGGTPLPTGFDPSLFAGRVDLSNVGLMGHSRGGEGMRAAAALYRDQNSVWPSRIPDLKIRAIFEIGGVDGQAGRVLEADDMAWNQLLPMCDGDVGDLEGRQPFERMLQKTSETRKSPKSLTMVYGANHNFFNTEWQKDDSVPCVNHQEIHGPGPVSVPQQQVAALELSAFMLANVGADRLPAMGTLFDPRFDVPSAITSITRVDRAHVFTYDRGYNVVVDDFENATGTSSNHVSNVAAGITVANDADEMPTRANVTWQSASPSNYMQLNWSKVGSGRVVDRMTSLDFRVGRALDQVNEPASNFSVALVDWAGHLSSPVAISQYVNLNGPASANLLYQTVRVPVGDFGLAHGTSIRGVRFVFDQSEKGALYFANVRFATDDPVAFAAAMNSALAPEPIVATPDLGGSSNGGNGGSAVGPGGGSVVTIPGTAIPGTSLPGTDLPAPAPSAPIPVGPAPGGFDPLARVSSNTRSGLGSDDIALLMNRAKIAHTKTFASSKFMSNRPTLEITVRSIQGVFPVEDQIPTLVIAGSKFSVSRYPPANTPNMLIFSIAHDDFVNLPERGSMFVQYGRSNARKFWTLPNYVKGELVH